MRDILSESILGMEWKLFGMHVACGTRRESLSPKDIEMCKGRVDSSSRPTCAFIFGELLSALVMLVQKPI